MTKKDSFSKQMHRFRSSPAYFPKRLNIWKANMQFLWAIGDRDKAIVFEGNARRLEQLHIIDFLKEFNTKVNLTLLGKKHHLNIKTVA